MHIFYKFCNFALSKLTSDPQTTKSMTQRITYAYPIESISRKFTLRRNTASSTMRVGAGTTRETVQKPVNRYMGGGVRRKAARGIGTIETNYMFVRFHKRSTPITQDERARQNLFTTTVKWTQQSRNNLSIIANITAAFNSDRTTLGVSSQGLDLYGFIFKVRYNQVVANPSITPESAEWNTWPGFDA